MESVIAEVQKEAQRGKPEKQLVSPRAAAFALLGMINWIYQWYKPEGELQTFNLIPVMSAIENVELPLKLTNLKRSEQREHAATALKLVGLGERMKHLPRQLSGGQEQRVAIARALVTDPNLIVADEPTGNLDSNSAQEVLGILQSLSRSAGKTVIMVTHDPKAAAFGSRAIHLEKGELSHEA